MSRKKTSGIKIKTDTGKRKTREPLPLVTLLLLLSGVFGILLFVKSLNYVDFSLFMILPVAAAFCFAFWYSYVRHSKIFWGLLIVSVSGWLLAEGAWSDVLLEQHTHIINSWESKPGLEVMLITETALLRAVSLSIELFVLECLVKNHAILYIFTTILLLLAPLMGVRTNVATIFLLILFQLAFWTIQVTDRRKRGRRLYTASGSKLTGKSGAAACIVLLIIFCISLPLVMFTSKNLFNTVYKTEGFVNRSINHLLGKEKTLVTGGKINRGNNYPTGAAHLELTAYRKPTEALYLRGFGGGEYIGGDWIRSSDEVLFSNIMKIYSQERWVRMTNNMYYNMYFTVNANRRRDDEDEEPAKSIALVTKHMNGEYGNAYVPYYNQRQYNWYWDTNGYVYSYYEQKDMNIDWEYVVPEFEKKKEWYRALQDAYIEQANEAYTTVPTELLPRLTALVEENPMTDLNDITAFILYTLHSNATYTLTPGWSAYNEDIVEYFLFERGAGFCEHFATTATLMYRLYGIPARYATGYLVQPSDFEELEDGSYRAIVTDESAHAWVEIFMKDFGWTPVEVTPADDGSTVASYPGFNGIVLNKIWKDKEWDVTVPSLTDDVLESLSPGEQSGDGFLREVEIDWKKYRDLFLALFSCLLYSAFLLPLFFDYRRLRILRKADTFGCRGVYYKFVEMLHFGGILPEYDGTEEEFADCLAKSEAGILEEDARQLVAVVGKASFGSKKPEESEEQFVKKLYNDTAAKIYEKLSWKKKLIFKYFKVFR